MKEPFFWEATFTHYFSLSMAAAFNDPIFTGTSLLTFFLIPRLTETEILPGMKESMEMQIEILKTQMYLNRGEHYEK